MMDKNLRTAVADWVALRIRREADAKHGNAAELARAFECSEAFISRVGKKDKDGKFVRPGDRVISAARKHWRMSEAQLHAAVLEWISSRNDHVGGEAPPALESASDLSAPPAHRMPKLAAPERMPRQFFLAGLEDAVELCERRWLPETIERLRGLGEHWPIDRPTALWVADGDLIDALLRRLGAQRSA